MWLKQKFEIERPAQGIMGRTPEWAVTATPSSTHFAQTGS